MMHLYDRFDDLLHKLLLSDPGMTALVLAIVGAVVVGGLFGYANHPKLRK